MGVGVAMSRLENMRGDTGMRIVGVRFFNAIVLSMDERARGYV